MPVPVVLDETLELSARTGAGRRSLRYYEEQGLLVSSRSPTGQRHYEDGHVQRVRLIQAFLAAGVPSGTIAEIRRLTRLGPV